MKAATVHELKKEMAQQSPAQLLELCARLARFKKENKELLTYLLFEAHDEDSYIQHVKEEIDLQFAEINKNNGLYLVKKSLRKILRNTNKHIRYSGIRTTEIQLLIYFCTKLKKSGIPIENSTTLTNLYSTQVKKINKILPLLHEDLQYDYSDDIRRL